MNKLLYKEANCNSHKQRKPTLNDLKDFPTNGIHQDIMNKAVFLNKNEELDVSKGEAVELIKAKFESSGQRRVLKYKEVENAVARACNSPSPTIKTLGRGVVLKQQFHKTSSDSFWNTEMPLPRVEAIPMAIERAIRATPWSLEDMFEDSPLRLWKCKPAEILSLLFHPTELICCGSVSKFKTLRTEEWLKERDVGEQIVPNPSRVKVGINKQGKPSEHCRDATSDRKYMVVESDDESLSFDEKASVLRFLRDEVRAKLKMVVHSGGKSLHGWYKSTGDSQVDWEFMKVACLLGADPRMWLPEQLARTPNGFRGKTNLQQKIYYFDAK